MALRLLGMPGRALIESPEVVGRGSHSDEADGLAAPPSTITEHPVPDAKTIFTLSLPYATITLFFIRSFERQ
ncbi:hypothetical protein ACFOY2_17280 [Nonomuraea purpurea]|uniref:Uncharacterized protein n=1 Tax=Nonomuraea purpurea TaxID=1849276 RepID=A0ABV8G4P4_9ACTN